jgi:hypothetical protein
MAAIIPEAGLSWWANAATRTTLGAKYYFTTDGRKEDFLLVGMTIEYLAWGSGNHSFPAEPPQTTTPELDEVLDSEAYFKTEKQNELHQQGLHHYQPSLPSDESTIEHLPPMPDWAGSVKEQFY